MLRRKNPTTDIYMSSWVEISFIPVLYIKLKCRIHILPVFLPL